MAQNKKELFEQEDIQLAEMLKSLSHPARVQIMRILAQKNSCICGEIVEILPLAQSTVSQHLIELKKAGLVKGTIDGAKSCYCINWDNFKKLELFVAGFVSSINENNCC
jgi:ArsR family transcriptional regulator